MKKNFVLTALTSFILIGCVASPSELARNVTKQCAASFGDRDSTAYWQCMEQNQPQYLDQFMPLDSAFIQLYYRAQKGIWSKYEHKKATYDESRTASLQLKDDFSRALIARKGEESNVDIKQSEAFMLRMKGYALSKQR